MKQLFALFAAIFLLQAGMAQQSAHPIDWQRDLDTLTVKLPQKHINLFSVRSKADWLAGIVAIKAALPQLRDADVALKIQQLVASMGDAHTKVWIMNWLDKSQMLPLEVRFWEDGLRIMRTTPENKVLLGERIEAIDGFPIQTVCDSLTTLVTVDNNSSAKSMYVGIPPLLPSLPILQYFGFVAPDATKVELTLSDGTKYTVSPADSTETARISAAPDSLSFVEANRKPLFTDHYFADSKIYYILYNECTGRESEEWYGLESAKAFPSFYEFEQRIFDTLAAKPVSKIIFDMRYNGGGDSRQGTAFANRLSPFLQARPDIRFYVVIGRDTFSSAIENAMDFKELEPNAVFVGEQTAGRPNMYGETTYFTLPSSGLWVNYSTKYFHTMDGEGNTIAPDVTIEPNFADYMRGIDPVYEWVERQ